jgi:hypothetical protein
MEVPGGELGGRAHKGRACRRKKTNWLRSSQALKEKGMPLPLLLLLLLLASGGWWVWVEWWWLLA